MKIFVDSGDVSRIREYRRIGLISGVTTNPEIYAVDGVSKNPAEMLQGVVSAAGDGYVFAQVISREPEEQVREALLLSKLGPNMVIKVIMDEVGLRSIPRMKAAGIPVSATAVNTTARALLAAECGADYIIPYYGWLQDSGEKPTGLLEDIAAVYRGQGYTTKLHVHCHRLEDLTMAARVGAWGALLSPSDLDRLLQHPQTQVAVGRHRDAWEGRYGQTTWLDFLGK